MKLSHKLYLPLIVFLIVITAIIAYSRINTISPPSITEEKPIELKEVKLSELVGTP